MLVKDFGDNQNHVVIQSDGDGILSDTDNLHQMGMLLETQDWHHTQTSFGSCLHSVSTTPELAPGMKRTHRLNTAFKMNFFQALWVVLCPARKPSLSPKC